MFASRRECHETMCDSVPEKVSWESISGKANRRRMTNTTCDAIRIFRILASDKMIPETERSYRFLGSRMFESHSVGSQFTRKIYEGFDQITSLYFSNASHKLAQRDNFSLKQLRILYFEFTNGLFPFQREDGRVRDFLLANASLPGC